MSAAHGPEPGRVEETLDVRSFLEPVRVLRIGVLRLLDDEPGSLEEMVVAAVVHVQVRVDHGRDILWGQPDLPQALLDCHGPVGLEVLHDLLGQLTDPRVHEYAEVLRLDEKRLEGGHVLLAVVGGLPVHEQSEVDLETAVGKQFNSLCGREIT
jgi:hypothetical protein